MEARRAPAALPLPLPLPPRSAPLMELHRSGRSGMPLPKRRPLADVTNAATAQHTSFSVKREARPKPTLTAPHDEISIAYDTSSIGSCSSENPPRRRAGPSASTSPVEMDSVHMRQRAKKQKTKCKASAGVLQSSCLSVGRIISFGEKQKIHEGAERHGSCSVPYPIPKKKWQYMLSEDINQERLTLPQEFIKKQRAYFAEIDAFELLEEVVSESELE